jgi:hypothetical protein
VAGNDNSSVEAHVAAQFVLDSGRQRIAADRLVVAQLVALDDDPIYPNLFYADPNHAPNDHPNVAVHRVAIHKSKPVADGNNVRGFLK